jgi:hypothetical protein
MEKRQPELDSTVDAPRHQHYHPTAQARLEHVGGNGVGGLGQNLETWPIALQL